MNKHLFDQTVAFDLYLKSQYNINIQKKLEEYIECTYYSNYLNIFSPKRSIYVMILLVFLLTIIGLFSNTELMDLTSAIILLFLMMTCMVFSIFMAYFTYFLIQKILNMMFGLDKDNIYAEVSWDIIRFYNFDLKLLFKNNSIRDHLNRYMKFFIFEVLVVLIVFSGLIFFIKYFVQYIYSIEYFEYYNAIVVFSFLLFLIIFTILYFFILLSLFFRNGSFKTIIEILRVGGIIEKLLPDTKNKIIYMSTFSIFYLSILLLDQTTNIYYALIELILVLGVPLLTIIVSHTINSRHFYKIKTIEFVFLISIIIINYFDLIDDYLYLNKTLLNFYIFPILFLLIFSLIIETIKVENSWKSIIDSLNKIKNNRNECFICKVKTIECYNNAIDYSTGPIFLSEHEYIQKLLNKINLKEVLINLRNYNHLTYQKELIKSIQFDDLCSGILDENVSKIHYFKIQLYEKLEKQNIEIIQLKHYKTLLKEILNNPEKLITYFVLLIIPLYIIIVLKESGLTGLIEAVKTLFKSYFFP